jgi:hypothetical protein
MDGHSASLRRLPANSAIQHYLKKVFASLCVRDVTPTKQSSTWVLNPVPPNLERSPILKARAATEPAATASPHDLLSELLRRKQAKETLVDQR